MTGGTSRLGSPTAMLACGLCGLGGLWSLCGSPEPAHAGPPPEGYRARVLHEAGGPVFLLGSGDLDPGHAGPELVAVTGDGTILLLTPDEPDWTAAPLPITVEPMLSMHDRPTVNVGDVHSGFAGNEIVVETGTTVRVLVRTGPAAWTSQVVLDGEEFFGITWGVRIGDIDAARPGLELFYMTETAGDICAGFFADESGDDWTSQWVFGAEVGMDSAIGDSDADAPGNEIVVATEMGPVYEITPEPGSPRLWPTRTLWDDFDNAAWTLRIADVLPDRAGNEIVYGTRYNDRVLLSAPQADRPPRNGPQGSAHAVEVLFEGQATGQTTMWDIAVGDVAPASPTLEIVAVDDLGLAYLVQHDGDAWGGQVLWQDPAGALHAAVVADYAPRIPGEEIVLAGASGSIVLITRDGMPLPGDVTGDGVVDVADLVAVITAWGPCPAPPAPCPADLDDDGTVAVTDLVIVIGGWS